MLLHVERTDERLYLNLCVLDVWYEDTRIPFAHLPLETETTGNSAQKPLYTHDGVSDETHVCGLYRLSHKRTDSSMGGQGVIDKYQ
jgi:hypothetical protein